MKIFNSLNEYGLLAKLFHWVSLLVLIIQIPFGFYLVGLEFSDERIELENLHIIIGITIFYITLFRLIWKFINPSPISSVNVFKGQAIIAKLNHFLLYLSILTITTSGILKKLYMGETLNFLFFNYGLKKDNFVLADTFYNVHIYSNYLLIGLVLIHILAVIVEKENMVKILVRKLL